ncbi:HD domain-containing protein [Pararhizobium gei]|uniref:HD domain-containing protein n=1 Tax=Pararhizobium gei TaxID=1395951 RepID=UPI0023DA79FB|nr:HD domain-containing protein [Rhizobium gei]
MREIIAVCRSEKQSRERVARVLDRYFWRIGDRTWRGKATNACLDRVSSELRKRATRNTAVVIHEIRSSAESRKPLIRIGSRLAFSDEGVVPIASHPADFKRHAGTLHAARCGAAALAIAALFHDLGKATNLFQEKLRRALNSAPPQADAVRHELFSAAVWDRLCGRTPDADLAAAVQGIAAEAIDRACCDVRPTLKDLQSAEKQVLRFDFMDRIGGLAHLIGMLILTHHRLPDADRSHVVFLADRHVRRESALNRDVDLAIAPGTPFWHETWWLEALHGQAAHLRADAAPSSADIALRASLMFADHLGSAKKTTHDTPPEHMANTVREEGWPESKPGDSLSRHVKRVYQYARFAHEMTHDLRDRYPALDQASLPVDIAYPQPSSNIRFAWQAEAALATRSVCAQREGGFFAAILAGTGTGKTRGAPTILAGAAMADKRPERRMLRLSLCLGLRVLATQSAREYVEDLAFRREDVAVLIGDPPLEFDDKTGGDEPPVAEQGSESRIHLPEWLRVEHVSGAVPQEGSAEEENWLRSLSLDTDRGLPAFLDMVLEKAGSGAKDGRRLIQAPVMVGTIDHLMGVAAPVNARFLLQSLRLLTSDLILDEIDQYDGEDLAAIGRLIFQAGAAGRRVIVMSATLTPDIAQAMYQAYRRGWADHARATGIAPDINLLVCGDTPGSVFTNIGQETLDDLLMHARTAILAAVQAALPLRRGEILPPCETWRDLVSQIDHGCCRLHGANAVTIDGFEVSIGLIRMTRIAHATALAVQMRSGVIGDRLRLLVCLHARLPRLHRSYIETRLKRALTRKGRDPDAGMRALCEAEGVFDRARSAGVRQIEIVVVASPVIETGNDLDFDYAILDPISVRAIIQTAGRVRRHRAARGQDVNVLILGRSPIAMQGGRLQRPGVETPPATETDLDRMDLLDAHPGRNFAALAGEADFSTISAAPLLVAQASLSFPLRDAEAKLRGRMISTDERDPLGKYLAKANARWNLKMTRTRRFRRSGTREALFCRIGESLEDSSWYVDLAPGTRNSALREAGKELCLSCDLKSVARLFIELTDKAWMALSGGQGEMERADIKACFQVSVPTYGDDIKIEMTYTEFTGFTRGKAEDLFGAFGKRN